MALFFLKANALLEKKSRRNIRQFVNASIFVFFFFPCVSPSVSKFGEQQSAHLFVYANTPFLTHVSEQAKAGADVPLFREPGPFHAITPPLNGELRYEMP